MKSLFYSYAVMVWMVAGSWAWGASLQMEYDILYKDKSVGSQTISINETADGLVRLVAESRLEVKILFKRYTFSDKLEATFQQGRVREFLYTALDDGKPVEIKGRQANDELVITKSEKGRKGVESRIAADAYDVHSWVMYLDPDLAFVEKAGSKPVRMLLLDEGVVSEQRIVKKGAETVSAEDKSFNAVRVEWIRKSHTHTTWHAPERRNVPLRFNYEDENGLTVFVLKQLRD